VKTVGERVDFPRLIQLVVDDLSMLVRVLFRGLILCFSGLCADGDPWNKVPNAPHEKWIFVPNCGDGTMNFQKFITN
jgi:hypothetical protein